MSVTNIRVRTTSAETEPGLLERRGDDLEARTRLARRYRPGAASGRPARRRSSRRPSTSRRRRRPGCSRRAPPTVRPTRSGGARSAGPSRRRRAALSRQATTAGSRPMASSSPASSVVRGTIDSISRYSAGEWSLPPIGPRPSRLGTPSPAVVFASDAPPVAASAIEKPRPSATAFACSTRRALRGELLHRPPARHRFELDGRVGHDRGLGDAADLGLRGLQLGRGSRHGRPPRASSARRRRSVACRRR